METTTVSCNKCGAALQVADTANFVTCRYCGTQLQVHRTDSTISTEILNRIDQRTAAMADDLSAIRQESEIERLDREWELRRQSLMVSGKNGVKKTPNVIGGIFIIVVGGGFGLFWTIMASKMTSRASSPFDSSGPGGVASIFPIFGIFFIIAAVGMGIFVIIRSSQYETEEQQYLQQRDAMLARRRTPDQQNS